jgi:hypothetical protein
MKMLRGGGIDILWNVSSLVVKVDSSRIFLNKTTSNEWSFIMPEGNVTITAAFSPVSKASTKLSSLNVSRGYLTTVPFDNTQVNHQAVVPHIFGEKPEDLRFFIEAVPEDPNADIAITFEESDNFYGEETELVEGARVYTIEVRSAAGVETRNYTLTVTYEPDVTLGSVTLRTPEGSETKWEQTLTLLPGMANLQNVLIPWPAVIIEASPQNDEAAVVITKTGGGTFTQTDGTLDFGQAVTPAVMKITVQKQVGSAWYTKEYSMSIKRDYLAEGGTVSIIKNGGVYYEVHTFTLTDTSKTSVTATLAFKDTSAESVTASILASVLVVAGGGGGGNSNSNDLGGGGGGGGVGYAETLELKKSTPLSVTVGAGGGSGGSTGYDSAFDGVTVKGGGGGGRGNGSASDGLSNGKQGGSGGGGGAGNNTIIGSGGAATAHAAVDKYKFYGSKGADSDTGTSGGNGGSSGFTSSISGTSTEYAKGGVKATGTTAAAGTGNGGGGSLSSSSTAGGAGGSGIVIVRFPAKTLVFQ